MGGVHHFSHEEGALGDLINDDYEVGPAERGDLSLNTYHMSDIMLVTGMVNFLCPLDWAMQCQTCGQTLF